MATVLPPRVALASPRGLLWADTDVAVRAASAAANAACLIIESPSVDSRGGGLSRAAGRRPRPSGRAGRDEEPGREAEDTDDAMDGLEGARGQGERRRHAPGHEEEERHVAEKGDGERRGGEPRHAREPR